MNFSKNLNELQNLLSTTTLRKNINFNTNIIMDQNNIILVLLLIAVLVAFYAIYLILISDNLSVITCIPLALIVIFGILIVKISGRENIEEFNSCLTNISSLDKIK